MVSAQTKAPALLRKRLIVCLGGGGVGKTSTSAAVALAAARAGRQCALLTVDPARRLQTALGLDEASGAPVSIEIDGDGTLEAMTLDTKRTFDQLIQRITPTAEIASGILGNPLYQQLSNELSGSTEYMAMEKLHELLNADYDLVVVDTPPGAHAGNLLGAPSRIAALVDSGAAAVLRAPASILSESRLANAALRPLLTGLERWIGSGLVSNLADFATAFEPLLGGFAERADAIESAMRRRSTALLIVTNTEASAIEGASAVIDALSTHKLKAAGAIVNQVQSIPKGEATGLRCAPELRAKLKENFATVQHRAKRDRATVRAIGKEIAPVVASLPRLIEPVASLAQLLELAGTVDSELRRRR